MYVDTTMYILICTALTLSLGVNVFALLAYLDKKYPHVITK